MGTRVCMCCPQAGEGLNLEWGRGRVFDQDVGGLFAASVRDAGSLRVASVTTKDEVRQRPAGNKAPWLGACTRRAWVGPASGRPV